MREREADVVIIGGGPAGLAAAIGAYEAGGRSIVVLDREDRPGGILKQCIHNGFGLHTFQEELTGPEYAARYIRKAAAYGIFPECGSTVISVSRDREVTAVSAKNGLEKIKAGAVVLAMGCRERPRGSLGTPGTRPAGVYTAGTAQKLTNLMGQMPGREVVILGSGDIGLIMARRMTFLGAKVRACVELMPYSSGLKRNIVQCLDDFGIPLLLSHTVTEIHGRERLEGVTVSAVDEKNNPVPGTETYYPCDTLLLSCGLIPENELSESAGVEISPATGGAAVDETFETSVPGVFACGNVLHVHDLVDYVSREAAEAGRNAAAYANGVRRAGRKIPVLAGPGAGGAVPQFVYEEGGELRFMFRPKAVYKNACAVITADGKEVLKKKSPVFTPGEMVNLLLPEQKRALLKGAGTVTVSIREAE